MHSVHTWHHLAPWPLGIIVSRRLDRDGDGQYTRFWVFLSSRYYDMNIGYINCIYIYICICIPYIYIYMYMYPIYICICIPYIYIYMYMYPINIYMYMYPIYIYMYMYPIYICICIPYISHHSPYGNMVLSETRAPQNPMVKSSFPG